MSDLCEVCPGVDDTVFGHPVCDGSGEPCETDHDCPDGESCRPSCEVAIPTVSAWGVVVLALLLMTVGKIYFGRRRMATG